MNINMTPIKNDNVDTLRDISIETFRDTFGDYNSEKDMQNYFDTAYNVDELKKEINEQNSNFKFVFCDHKLAGYLKLNIGDAQSELKVKNALEVERIYIKKEFKRNGLGTFLINYAMEQAKKNGLSTVWLGVWEKNEAAIHFYKRMGFREFDDHIFQLGNDQQRDLLFKKTVR
ncbi:GNAT family N-acetyltransferase [Apilactobacillus timberlakei]|uniref:GNAT family N-acetyltransferase n=1 Tax=Apilactobacillus timberlakei TaxID=2008380 RepID=UPI00112CACFF|nr:GNAT family N-acetyltransferase [Apilactobacillus timberlakei]TPR19574.1 GNAT family N-acetyltransferase [Apilactobacillus timberlakei]TPR20551.1 GNAT family N-acetyltransferase [Apilactobacillus timberlakei]TPR22595.1 GNAT family N-acetyltransferase [Apilactobacillus timberlakei]